MGRNISARLSQLADRRRGPSTFAFDSVTANAQLTLESYQEKSLKEYTKYTLGAMQEVGSSYTKISLAEAERVGEQLKAALAAKNIRIDTRIQGSVACNIHIKGHSDVDVLALDGRFFTYEATGVKARLGNYRIPYEKTPAEALIELRSEAVKGLRERYPAVDVRAGDKSISMSGGSLHRKVDVVPSHWHNTSEYQLSEEEWKRGVYILEAAKKTTLLNLPFVHIQKLNLRDSLSLGGLKKSIRLCKNVKADAESEGAKISLSSYDIAATMWHADLEGLILGAQAELAILSETERHLRFLASNHAYARLLHVPNETRKIFETPESLQALNALSAEISDLATEVALEQGRGLRPAGWEAIEKILKETKQIA